MKWCYTSVFVSIMGTSYSNLSLLQKISMDNVLRIYESNWIYSYLLKYSTWKLHFLCITFDGFDQGKLWKSRSSPPKIFFKKKMFLKNSQNSQEKNCTGVSFLMKLNFIKKKFWHRCFPANCANSLRTPIL